MVTRTTLFEKCREEIKIAVRPGAAALAAQLPKLWKKFLNVL